MRYVDEVDGAREERRKLVKSGIRCAIFWMKELSLGDLLPEIGDGTRLPVNEKGDLQEYWKYQEYVSLKYLY